MWRRRVRVDTFSVFEGNANPLIFGADSSAVDPVERSNEHRDADASVLEEVSMSNLDVADQQIAFKTPFAL